MSMRAALRDECAVMYVYWYMIFLPYILINLIGGNNVKTGKNLQNTV